MMYTKKEIADSIVKFISNDLMSDVDDGHKKFALCMAKKTLMNNSDVIDYFMDNPMISSVIQMKGDEYDIESFAKVLKNVLGDYESYTIMIPKIPMFAPKDSMIRVSAEDVDKIMMYLHSEHTESPTV